MQDLLIFSIVAMLIFIAPLIHKLTKLSIVVAEILLGALILNVGIIGEVASFREVAHIGFLFLMFLAGIEVDIKSFFSLGVGFLRKISVYFFTLYASAVGIVMAFELPLIYAVAFPVMSIGMIVILLQEFSKDVEWLSLALKIGIIGEIISISMLVLLNGYYSFGISGELYFSVVILAIFSVVVGVVFKLSDIAFWWFPNLKNVLIPDICDKNEDIRYAMMLFFLMITIVSLLNIEVALGAFISGVIISNFFKAHKSLHTRLNDIGFGFLIPIFFIYIGSTLDVNEIFSDKRIILNALNICVAMLVVRFVASIVAFRVRLMSARNILLFVLGSAMPLTFLIATATLGLNIGAIERIEYYSFVLAAMMEAVAFMTIIKIINVKFAQACALPTLDSANPQNLVKNKLCEAPENSPASWCKKSDSRLQKCNRRFFARSGESEALPLKAKKRSFLARRGSGAGGAALFAKESNKISRAGVAESTLDSTDSQNLKSGLPRRFCESARNDEFIRDSSPTAQNDKFKDFAESRADSANCAPKGKAK